MVTARCIDLSGIPLTQEGMYATNNQFQIAGPKGFIQVKVLENDNLYARVDLPGVPDDAVRYRVDGVRQKIVFFSGETLEDVNEKDGVRKYSGTAGLGCNCCEITNVDGKMKDGVLRMILSRVKVNKDQQNKCKSGRVVEDHPYVVKGRKGALFGASTAGGGLYFTVVFVRMMYKCSLGKIKSDTTRSNLRWKHRQSFLHYSTFSFEPYHHLGCRLWCSQDPYYTPPGNTNNN